MEKGYSCHLDDNVREEYPIWGMEQGAIICYFPDTFGLNHSCQKKPLLLP